MKDGKHVILCIDDENEILESLTIILEANGYLVIDAAGGAEGLALYKKEQPDFVLVDLVMDSIDAGVDFVKELKLLNSTVPCYLLSSLGDNLMSNVDYSELGFAGVLQKPISADLLLKTIKESLR